MRNLSVRVSVAALGLVAAQFAVGTTATAQALTARDSALVGRILLAEDRRNSLDISLGEGLRHANAGIRSLALRAHGRIVDPKFVARAALAPLPAPASWQEPEWRLRFRALPTSRDDCGALRSALLDDSWPVRLRAADLARASCAGDAVIVSTFIQWVDLLPARIAARDVAGVSWHAAAHGIAALARLRPEAARPRLARLATHGTWEVRQAAARAAGTLTDTQRLRSLARDADDNVAEVAIEQLSSLSGHTEDAIYLEAIGRNGAQLVRVAAVALKGSARPDVAPTARAAFNRFVARDNASERDARVALLEAAGLPASEDGPPSTRLTLSAAELADAIRLALGADVRLRVTMDPTVGGGSFVVRLRGDAAPIMAARLLGRARRGQFDGFTWHRAEYDFVIQGLSPGANEYVGADRYLRDELGGVSHLRGTVGMSTRGHDTGDAQWFVNLRDNVRLDAAYTVWAEVIEGIDVVDAVLAGDRVATVIEVPGRRPRS